MFSYFLTALALVLIIEGVLPFVSPKLWRRSAMLLASRKDSFLRKLGLVAMLLGLLIIYLVHHVQF